MSKKKHLETFKSVQNRNTMEIYSCYIVLIVEMKLKQKPVKGFPCVIQLLCDTQ